MGLSYKEGFGSAKKKGRLKRGERREARRRRKGFCKPLFEDGRNTPKSSSGLQKVDPKRERHGFGKSSMQAFRRGIKIHARGAKQRFEAANTRKSLLREHCWKRWKK